ncbi:MAG: cellulase family glycosylhydrolase [Kiritimatiellia bacterium]|jgi:aryl-phospho-beta-D-glucosidase BglC (GH1 family)
MKTLACTAALASATAPAGATWYKGMIHAHSLWSDGRALPEQAVKAYKDAGYDFFSLTDHNRNGSNPDFWFAVGEPKKGVWPPTSIETSVFESYTNAFPDARWRERDGGLEVRVPPFSEVHAKFEEPGKFLLLPGVEATIAVHDENKVRRDIHMNYVGIKGLIPRASKTGLIEWVYDSTVADTLRATKDEVDALWEAEGKPPSLFFVDHPHWRFYDVLPEDIIANPDVRFFEVCNSGSDWPSVDPLPRDDFDNDRFWDAVNAARCNRGEPLLYGLATEDTHRYPGSGTTKTPLYFGDAWIRVRAASLTAKDLFEAMDRGDFYASGGVDFEDVSFDPATGALAVAVPAKEGVRYTVRFITTKRGVPTHPLRTVTIPAEGDRPVRRLPVYSDGIGATVKVVEGKPGEGVRASCTLAADDLYVRARVESDEKAVYYRPGHLRPPVKTAWTQPFRLEEAPMGDDFRAGYSDAVRNRPQQRGAMITQGRVSEEDLGGLRSWGATIIRYQMLPTRVQWTAPTNTPEGFDAWLDWKLDELTSHVLPLARKHGLEVVVDLHVPPGGRDPHMKMLDNPRWAGCFVSAWEKIARRLQGETGIYAYDLINEPTQFRKPRHCDYLEIQRRAAHAIRAIDPETPVIVSCNADIAWCAPSAFRSLRPIAEHNIFYQFHFYEPFEYTHQKVLPQFMDVVAAYPDPARGWDKEGLRKILEPVRAFEKKHGARIFVGEFSTIAYGEGAAEWIADVVSLLNEYEWDWCYHAFREWPGWSVEHEVVSGDCVQSAVFAPSEDNPRKKALLDGFRENR